MTEASETPKEGQGGPTWHPGGQVARPHPWPRHQGAWVPGGAPWPSFGAPEASCTLIFYIFFLEFLEHFK